MFTEVKRTSILIQVAVFFIIGVVVTGILGYFSQQIISQNSVMSSTESMASRVADEVIESVHQYPAYEWLMDYWCEHDKEMDIEYDAPMIKGTETSKKCKLLQKRHPKLQLEYATTEQVEALPAEDQKLYAEIIYSWLITRLDQIKQAHEMTFLYICLTDDTYKTQYFLASAADKGAVRGTEYQQVYTLGVTSSMEDNEALQDGMRDACENSRHLSAAGDYMDYYAYMGEVAHQHALVGLTFSVNALKKEANSQTFRGTFFAILYQILLALICLVLIYVFLLRPLKKVQETIRIYKETKNSEVVSESLSTLHSRNEIMALSEDVYGLAEEIDDYLNKIESITKERERIGAELNIASQIQINMMPSATETITGHGAFEVNASMDPAKEVGGDFYDFFLIDKDHLCLVMADVSGKGVPAALFMVIAKTLIKNRALMGESPAQILTGVNNQLCEGNKYEMFVTVWIAILDLNTGKGIAANAGHEHPVIRRSHGQFELVKYRHSPIIGAMEGINFKEHEFQLEPGETIFVYTDGLPEATNAGLEMFGEERMLQTLNESPDASLEELLQKMKTRVIDFTGDASQFDDLTMLAAKWLGPEGSEESE